MSYQVIARKYRPQAFQDLAGQEHITRTLSNALESGRLHHAYLFSGVRGTGKTTTARIFAKGLNCLKGVTGRPCLECPSCLEIAAGNSMDVLEIDAASNTGVDNVRDVIINNLALAPARDRYKIFIIDEVHMLSGQAFNALLKTIEEPPSHVVFIMATTELHKVPETILSRCQQFEFRQIPTEKIFHRLREIADQESVKIADSALREIARAGAGSLRDAQSAFDQVIAFSGSEITGEDVVTALGLVSATTLGDITEAIANQDTSTLLNLVEEITSRGYDLRNFSRELMAYLRHLLVVKSGIVNPEMLDVTDIEIERLERLAPLFSEEDLVRSFHLLADTEKAIKDSSHPRFQLEIGLVKLAQAARLRSLDELLRRLEELESRFSGGAGSVGGGSQPGSGGRRGPGEQPPPHENYDPGSQYRSAGRPSVREAAVEPPEPPDIDQSEPEIGFDPTSAPGDEIAIIHRELERMNRGLILTALEDAQKLEFLNETLIVTFREDDRLARRVRDSSTLFRNLGEKAFGKPIRIEVRISGQIEKTVDPVAESRQQLQNRALNNPAVKKIIEKTRGEIVWVRENQNPETGDRG